MPSLRLALAAAALLGCGARSELRDPTVASDARTCGAPWVVFSLHRSPADDAHPFQMYARRADGSDGHPLALDHAAMYPVGAPDSSALLFADDGAQHLYLYRFADRSLRALGTQGPVGHAALSPDGRSVVYGNGTNVLLVPTAGGAQRFLVPSTAAPGGSAGYPLVAGDSQTVLYAAVGVLQSIRVDGTGMRTLVNIGGSVTFPNPTLSPDRTRVAAVVTCADEAPQLRVYPLASLPAPCTAGTVVATMRERLSYYDPSWGPSGQIAWSSAGDIFLVDAAGGTPTDLTADLRGSGFDAALWPTWLSGCLELP